MLDFHKMFLPKKKKNYNTFTNHYNLLQPPLPRAAHISRQSLIARWRAFSGTNLALIWQPQKFTSCRVSVPTLLLLRYLVSPVPAQPALPPSCEIY